jgi:hypothetical protein
MQETQLAACANVEQCHVVRIRDRSDKTCLIVTDRRCNGDTVCRVSNYGLLCLDGLQRHWIEHVACGSEHSVRVLDVFELGPRGHIGIMRPR